MTAIARTDPRARLIRLIHVAKRDLAMDDDAYRLLLTRCAGKDSAAAMSIMELKKVWHHMKHAGFRVRKSPIHRLLAQEPTDTKIRALWLSLHKLGAVKNPSEEALAAYVKRITGIDALQWIDMDQAVQVIETLKQWAARFQRTGA